MSDEDELRTLFGRLADRQPVHGTDGAWLTTRLRRRRQRQVALGAAALVVAVSGAALAVALPTSHEDGLQVAQSPAPLASPSPSPSAQPSAVPSPRPSAARAPVPPALAEKTRARLIVVQGTKLEVLSVDTGGVTALAAPADAAQYDRFDLLAVQEELVMVGDNNTGAGSGPFPVYVTTAGPGSALRVIGQASYLLASDRADRVWLVADKDTNASDAGTTLVEVDVRGVVHQRATFRHTFGVKPFAGAFLREVVTADGGFAGSTDLVDGAGRRLHRYAGSVVIAAAKTAVLSQGDVPCAHDCRLLVLTAGAQILERTVAFDSLPYLMELGLSRDSTRLFTSVIDEVDPGQPSYVTELDLEAGQRRLVRDAWAGTFYGPSFQFTPDGRWMFFTDVDKVHVDAYDVSSRTAYRVKGTFDTITQLALLP